MSSHQRNHTAIIRWLLFVCLLYSGSSLEAQIEAPTPVPTQEAPFKSKETSDDSELKIQNYQLKHAKAAEVLKLFKQLHGIKNAATVDERTNSIVFFANDEAARELRESLGLLDSETPSPIISPTPVVQGSSPKVPSPEKSKPAGPFRKFTFKHAKVADVLKILRELAGSTNENDNVFGFAVDERTNSVIWKVKDEWESRHWEETLLTLDGESSASKIQSAPSPYAPPASVSAQPTQTFAFSIDFARGESLESLKQRYNELEQQAHQLADKLKQSKSPSESELGVLKAAVRKSFEARQALQRAELADLAQRMKSMQQSIDMRDKLADKVVQRRVEDLLNHNLKWDLTEPTAIVRTESSSKPKSIKEAVSAILLNAKSDSVPYELAAVGILYEGKAEIGDFKEEIFEQVEAEARTFAHFQLISRRVADAAMADSRLRLKDLFVAENTRSLFPVMTKFGQSMDFLLLLRLEEVDVSRGESEGNFRLTLRLVDKTGQAFTEQIDVSKGKLADVSKQSTQQFTQRYLSPQELLDAVEQRGKSGSYEDFATLFNDEGVRDLAGSLLMQAVMQTSIDDLSRQLAFGGVAEVEPDFVAFRKVLQRWLPQSVTTAQQEAMGKGLSTIISSIGGASPEQTTMKEFVTSMRKSVEGIADHRKFCVELMQAFEKLTTKPFVYFGNADQKNEWQISQFGDRAIATLIDGSPGMATTITLQQASGDWRISSLFNELVAEAQPITPSPNAIGAEQSNSKIITRRYSVGSFVTESFFTGKGNYDLKEIYEKYETDIEQSLADLAKTVTATCSQPPKFVQVLSSSRCLLIGHTEAGHQEIANFMSDIGISNDRIRLRGVAIEITKDDVKSLGIDLTQEFIQLLSSEKAEQLRAFQKEKKPESESGSHEFNFVAMDEAIQSGTRTHVKTMEVALQFPFAARIVPGTMKVQIRMDFHSASGGVEIFSPRIQSLSDAQSVLFVFGDDLYWLASAEIVQDAIVGAEHNDKAASNPLPPSTPAMEMQQRLQGEWDVKVISFSAGEPKELVIRDDLLILPGAVLGNPVVTSMKLEWTNQRQPDEVNILWEPNNQPSAHVIMEPLVGRIRCEGDQLQLCFVDGSGKVTQRPREMCGGAGIFYLECTRKRASESSKPVKASESDIRSSKGPKYSGHALSWWLDSYWANAIANPKTTENTAQEYVASEAIRKLRELPECEAAIEAALAKWFASVEHEVNEGQLTRAAKCIVEAAGPKNQKLAVDYLFEIAKRVPINQGEEDLGTWIDCWDDELDEALKGLVLNDELATQIADRLKTGNSAQRRFAVTILLNRDASNQQETQDQTEANVWFRSHDKLFYPAFEAASQDTSEAIRMFALLALTGIDPHHSQLPFQLKTVAESDPSTQVRCVAIQLLCSKELASSIEAQSVELQPLLMKALEADSSVDVRDAALGALMAMDKDSELVHATLLRWARCKERVQVEYALTLMLRNHEAGDRPQSIDELIELLSDPEWGIDGAITERIPSGILSGGLESRQILARQQAIRILGKYAAHAHCALPTLEAELARNNKDTLSFATEAIDSVRGYCPDRPIDQLQGQWEFVSVNRPSSSTPFFDFPLHPGGVYPAVGCEIRTASPELPPSIINVSGTQLKLGGRVLAEISHQRQNLEIVMLLDPDGKKRHCHGGYNFKGGPTPEYKPNVAPAPDLLILEVSELLNNLDATQATKQIYEFRRVKK